jgi:hypothetical protein
VGTIGVIILAFILIGVLNGKKGKRRKKSVPKQAQAKKIPSATRDQVQIKVQIEPNTTRFMPKATFNWHPPGRSLVIAGHTIPDGMVYSGTSTEYQVDGSGCIIDASLNVARSAAPGINLGYWPSYRSISPTARFSYLGWLSSGKSDPDIDIGYVFLYFYGLERRLLADRPSPEEETRLLAEVARLHSIYSNNHSFSGYSRRLIDAVEFKRLIRDPALAAGFQPDLTMAAGRMPMVLKAVIARKVIADEPLGFELATAGLLGLPWDVMPRNDTVLRFARSEFMQLLRRRFEKAFPAGFKLRNRKDSRLRLDYQPASMGLQIHQENAENLETLPDPATLTWTKLGKLVIQVSAELEPYVKVLAYHPERSDSLLALANCPPDLAKTVAPNARSWIEGLSRPICSVHFADLALHAIGVKGAKWTLRHHRLAAEALTKFGKGMEPDPADGSEALADDTEVFIITDPVCLAPKSPGFRIAAAAGILVAAMARATNGRSVSVEERWLELAQRRMGLTPGDILRMRARLQWLRSSNAGLAKVKRLLAGASQTERENVAWSAAVAAAAGGLVEKPQIALLETICDKLDVSRRSLYTAIHVAAASSALPAAEPVVVSTDAPAVVHAIPKPPQPEKHGLDRERLHAVRMETERVSSVLAEIFVEEEPQPPRPLGANDASNPLSDLDTALAAFVTKLTTKAEWSRAEFDGAARDAGLMPDGCLEAINEWAFDHFDEALIEDGEIMAINVSLLDMMAIQANAP